MIDPKELHIGAHIMVDGVRARVTDIEFNYNWSGDTLLRVCAVIDGEKRTCGAFSQKDGVEPIPITGELLMELGFKKDMSYTFPPKHFYIDAETAKLKAEGVESIVPRITISYAEVEAPFWYVEVYGKNMSDNRMAVHYLHELEQILYLTTKTELIKE